VVGRDEAQNTRAIQESILPHAERWAKQSGAIFEADKTSLIHFTRRADPDDSQPIHFGGKVATPQQSVKVLGVILDKKLSMDEHIARVIQKATGACLSLQAIKGVRPAQMKQLVRSCILPITDYAASAWYGPGKPGVVRQINALERVQRLGARVILRAWKAVSLPILEAEAHLESTKERLDRKVLAHTVKLISLPYSNPVRKALKHAFNIYRYISPLSAVYKAAEKRLKPRGVGPPMASPPWIQPPWISHSHRVEIKEKSLAMREASRIAGANILGLYSDASVAKRLASIAVVQRSGVALQIVRQDSIGWASTCGVLSAEIAAILAALEYAQENIRPPSDLATSKLFIFSDSQQALRAMQAGNDANAGRALLKRISEDIDNLIQSGVDVRFRWSPGHEGVVGNEEANDAAREASSQEGRPTARACERVREIGGVIRLINRDRSENPTPFDATGLPGQYTWRMDKALPGKHTLNLYRSLTSDETAILIQARTGHCRLNQNLYRIGLVDEATCICGEDEETIRHLILSCPRWKAERRELREAVGARSGDVPYLLGGWGSRKNVTTGQLLDGPKEKWKPDMEAVKATIRFLEKTGRLSYQQTADQLAAE
jgi:ribonuclease HI